MLDFLKEIHCNKDIILWVKMSEKSYKIANIH